MVFKKYPVKHGCLEKGVGVIFHLRESIVLFSRLDLERESTDAELNDIVEYSKPQNTW